MITLGGGAVISKSSKQKLEAELVGLADGIPTVLWTKNFLEEQVFKVEAATVHQDNKSTSQQLFLQKKENQLPTAPDTLTFDTSL